jgi:demethylmenaquinone methyltransferase/2-methoxy-6-polyprenyl-1,4-benzoquinol methylase
MATGGPFDYGSGEITSSPDQKSMQEAETTHFGERTVPLTDKQGLVDEVFNKVAGRYDLMNDVMSAGIHRIWKDALVARLAPPKRGTLPYRVLDMAGGTGDVAERIVNASVGYAEVTVGDINEEMLAVGRERAKAWRFPRQVTFVTANAEALPFEDETFDAYTIAFGIRNVPRIEAALGEAFRVLKRGGRFLCLEFSAVDLPGLDRLYGLYSNALIPPMGKLVTGDGEPYRYLVESIRNFPGPERFSAMIAGAGFRRVTHTAFSGNIAALHAAWKL